MKLFHAVGSPFVRKCLVCAHELNLQERLELAPAAPSPIKRDRALVALNPLGTVPTLMTEEGISLYDSPVICEYLNSVGDGRLLPASGAKRWAVLVDQALADGIMDAALSTRYETAVRPEPLRWSEWVAGQLDKVGSGVTELERRAAELGDRIDIGTIAMGCALGYLDFRFASLGWPKSAPSLASWFERFSQRESMVATRLPAS